MLPVRPPAAHLAPARGAQAKPSRPISEVAYIAADNAVSHRQHGQWMQEHMRGLPNNKMSGRANGQTVYFTPDQVHAGSLGFGNGNGIVHPSLPKDTMHWANYVSPHTNSYVKNYHDIGNDVVYGEEVPAPWSGRPFKVIGHADHNGFQIAVNTAPAGHPPTYELVSISGDMHGRLVASNIHFQEAMARDPQTALTLLACSANAVGGTAARNSVNYLRNNTPFAGEAYAGTGTVVLLPGGGIGVERGRGYPSGIPVDGEIRDVKNH